METQIPEHILIMTHSSSNLQLLFRKEVLLTANPAFQNQFPGFSPGCSAEDIFGPGVEQFRCFTGEGSLLFSVSFPGATMDVKLSQLEDLTLAELLPDQESISASALQSIARSLAEPLTGIKVLSPKLLPLLTQSGDPVITEQTAQFNKSLYNILRVSNHIRFSATEQLRPNKKPLEIMAWLREFAGKVGPLCAMSGKQLVTELPPVEETVNFDPELLEQALLNLISNAIKFTGPDGEIHLSAKKIGRARLHITLRDNGQGIPAHRMGLLFSVGKQAPLIPDPRQGIGLGLPTARKILRAHGGSLFLESTEGTGTAIHLALPISRITGDLQLKAPVLVPQISGGIDPLLLELADALPAQAFQVDDTEI